MNFKIKKILRIDNHEYYNFILSQVVIKQSKEATMLRQRNEVENLNLISHSEKANHLFFIEFTHFDVDILTIIQVFLMKKINFNLHGQHLGPAKVEARLREIRAHREVRTYVINLPPKRTSFKAIRLVRDQVPRIISTSSH